MKQILGWPGLCARETLGKVLVNVDVAASMSGVSRRTVYNWLKAGLLRYCRTAGGSVRIDPESLFMARKGDGHGAGGA